PPSSALLRPYGGAAPVRPPSGDRLAGRDGRGHPAEGITMTTDRDIPHTSSPTEYVLTELQLHGYRPFEDEPDPRPLPEARSLGGAAPDFFDAMIATLRDTRLEPDLDDLLWSTVNLFHRAAERVGHELDTNESAQKRSQKEQDGSEIRSMELERLLAQGLTLIERRDSMELLRDHAADLYERHNGSASHPPRRPMH